MTSGQERWSFIINDSRHGLAYGNSLTAQPIRRGQLDRNREMDKFLAQVERRALRVAQFATASREDAFDIVQDAMYKLVDKYGNHHPDEWGPLFHRILHSRIQDWHRRALVRTRFRGWLGLNQDEDEQEDPFQTVADPAGQSPEAMLGSGRAMLALQKAVAELPLRQQQAFLLRVWEGFDVKQTARVMGCAEGSVKTHYSRAVHALREKLGGHWE
jgi:RNA polymerase sigma-70 factor, ECF subfamily